MTTIVVKNYSHLSEKQARNLVLKALLDEPMDIDYISTNGEFYYPDLKVSLDRQIDVYFNTVDLWIISDRGVVPDDL